MIIKNKKKFIRAILIIMVVTGGIVIFMTNISLSHQELTCKTVTVTSGDTLWNIAEKEKKSNSYYKNNDIRDIIIDLKAVNNLVSSNLIENQILEIPTY